MAMVALAVMCLLTFALWKDDNFAEPPPPHHGTNAAAENAHLDKKTKAGDSAGSDWIVGPIKAFRDAKQTFLCIANGCIEASMYIFIFFWTPALTYYVGNTSIPDSVPKGIQLGLIFTALMTCISLGSAIYSICTYLFGSRCNTPLLMTSAGVAAAACFVAAIFPNFYVFLFAFFTLEVCCGLYFPSIAAMRSVVIPETYRTVMMNLYRVLPNLIVVIVLNTVSNKTEKQGWSSLKRARAAMGINGCLNATALLFIVLLRCQLNRESRDKERAGAINDGDGARDGLLANEDGADSGRGGGGVEGSRGGDGGGSGGGGIGVGGSGEDGAPIAGGDT